MNIATLHQDAMQALTGELDEQEVRRLTKMALHFADMVGWATGVIDADGRVQAAFDQVRHAARERFETDRNQDVAALHDAIAELLDAIVTHDQDLAPVRSDDEDVYDM